MKDIIAKENIYNSKGVLLVAKGQKITKYIVQKLQSLNLSSENEEPSVLNKSISIAECSEKITKTYPYIDSVLIEKATDILNSKIFYSKSEPWWFLICTLSNYDEWLYTHSIDVALISTMMLIKLTNNEREQNQICLGALLHDIGKLLIPKRLLQDFDKLNDQEKSIVKQHCELGYDMITKIDLSEECADIVLQHHERMDGSGYPNQIKEKEISEFAKIVMIADAVDNITSYGFHQETKDIRNGIQTLLEEHSQFDSRYVRLLCECMGEKVKNKEQ